jgi:hypothetical protein
MACGLATADVAAGWRILGGISDVRVAGLAGGLVMGNVLAVLTYRVLARPGARRPFVMGFVLAGLAAAPLVIPYLEAIRDPLLDLFLRVLNAVPVSRRWNQGVPRDALGWATYAGVAVLVLNLVVGLPWLLVAAAGGGLDAWWTRRRRMVREEPVGSGVGRNAAGGDERGRGEEPGRGRGGRSEAWCSWSSWRRSTSGRWAC